MVQLHHADNLNYEEYVDGLRRSNAELLKALQTIEGAFWSDGERYREQVTDLKEIARAAIAKATGGAHGWESGDREPPQYLKRALRDLARELSKVNHLTILPLQS